MYPLWAVRVNLLAQRHINNQLGGARDWTNNGSTSWGKPTLTFHFKTSYNTTVLPLIFFKTTVLPFTFISKLPEKTTDKWQLPLKFFSKRQLPLTFSSKRQRYHWRFFKTTVTFFFENDIKKRQCYPLRFFQKDSHPLCFFKTTVLPLIFFFQNDWWKTSYPVFFYSRQINNDSVTPYVFFQNDSVTHWFFSKQQINNSVTLTFFFKTTILPLKFFFKTTDNTRQCYALGLYVPLMSS